MSKRYTISEDQKAELKAARKTNKNKNVEKRLKAIVLRGEGRKSAEVGMITGFHPSYVSQLVSRYCNEGLSAIVENHYVGNRRNMKLEEEKSFLETYKAQAEKGQIVEVGVIRKAYEEKVGHTIGGSQIYYVLQRHKWRKLMPRSRHPKKASDEVIEASKKLRTQ